MGRTHTSTREQSLGRFGTSQNVRVNFPSVNFLLSSFWFCPGCIHTHLGAVFSSPSIFFSRGAFKDETSLLFSVVLFFLFNLDKKKRLEAAGCSDKEADIGELRV